MQTVPLRSVKADPVLESYERLRRAQQASPFPSVEERQDWLERLERVLVENAERFVATIDADFGGRSRHETLLADIYATLEGVRDARKHLALWMRPRSAMPSPYFLPSKAMVEPIPRGVVGIIAPWNYPVNLALAPLAGALAAGNRALLKPSELTPRTAELLGHAIRERFSAAEIAVVEGGPDVAAAVTKLPLDHLLFTGSTNVGKKVALAAAENLVATTLELGGKSPALVHPTYSLGHAAKRIALGKLFNAGQTCIAPDYALIPEGRETEFANAFRAVALEAYPELPRGNDYTAIVSDTHRARLLAMLDDARAKGARVEVLGGASDGHSRRLAPALVFGPTPAMRVLQEEIFGPILPVVTYRVLEEALAFIVQRPRPLAFYYFDDDANRAQDVLRRTPSGGACVNDTLVHFAQEGLPFGGIGPSGQGAYHGQAGFETFSHLRGVLHASPLSAARRLQAPPYGKTLDAALEFLVGGVRRSTPLRIARALRRR